MSVLNVILFVMILFLFFILHNPLKKKTDNLRKRVMLYNKCPKMDNIEERIKKLEKTITLYTKKMIVLRCILFSVVILLISDRYHENIRKCIENFSSTNNFSSFITMDSNLSTSSWCKEDKTYYAIWERLLNDDLMFSHYKRITEEHAKDEIEKKYADLISQCNIAAMIDDSRLLEDINYFVSAGILPEPKEDIYLINGMINSYSDRMDVPIEIYQKELVLRIRRQIKYPTRSNAYQAARAADDILEILKISGTCSYEELVLYSAFAIDLYSIALSFPEEDVTNPDSHLNYRTGVLYVALYQQTFQRKIEHPELRSHHEHFLQCAYGFFKYSNNLESSEATEIRHTDFDYYMSYILYYQITEFDYAEKYEECAYHTNKYLTNPAAKNETYITSCSDIRNYLIGINPELSTYFSDCQPEN